MTDKSTQIFMKRFGLWQVRNRKHLYATHTALQKQLLFAHQNSVKPHKHIHIIYKCLY